MLRYFQFLIKRQAVVYCNTIYNYFSVFTWIHANQKDTSFVGTSGTSLSNILVINTTHGVNVWVGGACCVWGGADGLTHSALVRVRLCDSGAEGRAGILLIVHVKSNNYTI